MPYVNKTLRSEFDVVLHPLIQKVLSHWEANQHPGILNYVISKVMWTVAHEHKSYATLNSLVGILECAKQELYRRIAAPYEDEKIEQNGDVQPEAQYETKVYVAGRYEWRDSLVEEAKRLNIAGVKVTSSWLNRDRPVEEEVSEEVLDLEGQLDLRDIERSDALMLFTAHPETGESGTGGLQIVERGGRHAEFGYALALGKRCILIGPRIPENPFHRVPGVEQYSSLDTFLEARKGKVKQ